MERRKLIAMNLALMMAYIRPPNWWEAANDQRKPKPKPGKDRTKIKAARKQNRSRK